MISQSDSRAKLNCFVGEAGSLQVSRLEFKSLDLPSNLEAFVDSTDIDEQPEPVMQDGGDLENRQVELVQQRLAMELETASLAGREMGREEAKAEYASQLKEERTLVAKALEDFHRERSQYFLAVEKQVVELSLAIATRILHREVNMDPLLLRGVVKVALAKVHEESGTVLRVPLSDVSAWRELMATDVGPEVDVLGESSFSAGECVLETSVGRVELGVAAQLEEIDKCFFDLMQLRPA